MNVEEYKQASKDIYSQIDPILYEMYENFERTLENNAETISNLIITDFNFIPLSRQGNVLKKTSPSYLEISNGIYLDYMSKNLCTLSYDAEYDFSLPNEIEKYSVMDLFKDVEFYKDVMHIVELSGMLEASIKNDQTLLNNLKNI